MKSQHGPAIETDLASTWDPRGSSLCRLGLHHLCKIGLPHNGIIEIPEVSRTSGPKCTTHAPSEKIREMFVQASCLAESRDMPNKKCTVQQSQRVIARSPVLVGVGRMRSFPSTLHCDPTDLVPASVRCSENVGGQRSCFSALPVM